MLLISVVYWTCQVCISEYLSPRCKTMGYIPLRANSFLLSSYIKFNFIDLNGCPFMLFQEVRKS